MPALLFLQLLDFLLNRVLLIQSGSLTGLTAQGLDLFLGVFKRLLGRKHHVVGPLLQFLTRVVEVLAVLLQRAAYRRIDVALGFCLKTPSDFACKPNILIDARCTAEELFNRFLIKRPATCVKAGEEQVRLALERIGREARQGQIAASAFERLDHMDPRGVIRHVEDHPRGRRSQPLGFVHNVFAERMGYAMQNLREMVDLVLAALKRHLPAFDAAGEVVNCHHNYVTLEHHYGADVWLTRKGAIRSRAGHLGIIPGSMGARSYIVRGKGNAESFDSCAHGAGRRMSRSAANKQFSAADLVRQTEGVICRKDKGVVDEIPGAYKDIDTVMANQSDLVEVLHTLKQVVCVKG